MGQSVPSRGARTEQKLFQFYQITKKGIWKIIQKYLAGSGCFFWKSNWTKFDHVGNTGGYWETMSSSFSISFGSSKSVYAFYNVSRHGKIDE